MSFTRPRAKATHASHPPPPRSTSSTGWCHLHRHPHRWPNTARAAYPTGRSPSARARQAGTRICQDEEVLRDSPVLASETLTQRTALRDVYNLFNLFIYSVNPHKSSISEVEKKRPFDGRFDSLVYRRLDRRSPSEPLCETSLFSFLFIVVCKSCCRLLWGRSHRLFRQVEPI